MSAEFIRFSMGYGTIPAQATPSLGVLIDSVFQGVPSRVILQVISPVAVGFDAVR